LQAGEPGSSFGPPDAVSLLHGIPDAVLCADAAGRIVFANAAALRLLDRPADRLLGVSVRGVVGAWPSVAEDLARSRQVETVVLRRDGAVLPVEVSFVAWGEGSHALTGAMLRSILDRTVSEAMLEEAHAQARRAEAEARAAHDRLREVIEMQPHAVCVLDPEDRYVLWNGRYAELYPEISGLLRPGVAFLDILRASAASGRMPEAAGDPEAWLAYRMAKHALPAIQEEQEMRDGRWMRYDDRRLSDGSTIGVRVDITELKQREETFRLLFDENPVPLLLLDPATLRLTAVNAAAIRRYGLGREAFLAMAAPDLHVPGEAVRAAAMLHSADRASEAETVWRHRCADGGEIAVLLFVRTMAGAVPGLLVAILDVTKRVRAEERVAHLAMHDALTGLANRMQFHRALDQALAEPQGPWTALFCLDLDGFKPVNDTFGHAAGDAVLRLVADRLRSAVPGADLVARLGGDEFAVIHRSDADDLAETAERLVATMRAPFQVDGALVGIGVSIGLARLEPGEDADRLMARADAALYAAKAAGRGTWILAPAGDRS